MDENDRRQVEFLIEGLRTGLCVPSAAAERLAEIMARMPRSFPARLESHNVWSLKGPLFSCSQVEKELGFKPLDGMPVLVSIRPDTN